MTLIPIILSGGAGTRLWPLSWGDHPKQFLKLTSDKTMIQETLLRLRGLEISSPIVSCGEGHRFLVAQQIGEIMSDIDFKVTQYSDNRGQLNTKINKYLDSSIEKPTILLEPTAKNTAPAIACACCAALRRDVNAVVIVLPSDHVIADVAAFQKAVITAVNQAEQGYLVTFGIVPTFPATGYGYVKSGPSTGSGTADTESGSEIENVFSLEKFVEKPCLEKAQEYLASGEYSWNSGMFVFKAATFLDELKKYNPEMAELAVKAFENADCDSDFTRLNAEYFSQIKGDSIDYAVMEKTKLGKIVKLNAGWDDVGSWSALYDISPKDKDNNAVKGDVITLNTKNSYIRGGKRTIATIGLDNLVIVDSDDSLLIAQMDQIQDVKKIAEEMKKRGE